jgi:hypothetical protein
MVGCTFILRGSSCKGYFYACLSLSSTTGKYIYNAMLKICTEASHFISVVNDLFVKYGWNPVVGNGVMWDRSTHYAQPRFWLPYFQQRVFTTEQEPTKGIGINIIFDEAYGELANTIPFVSCCYIKIENSGTLNKCDEIYYAGWSETSEVLDETHSKLYKTFYPNRMTIVNYFLPLDVLSNQQAVESYIIKPLIELYNGNILGTYICEVKREDEKDGNSHFVNSCWLYWLASCMV